MLPGNDVTFTKKRKKERIADHDDTYIYRERKWLNVKVYYFSQLV